MELGAGYWTENNLGRGGGKGECIGRGLKVWTIRVEYIDFLKTALNPPPQTVISYYSVFGFEAGSHAQAMAEQEKQDGAVGGGRGLGRTRSLIFGLMGGRDWEDGKGDNCEYARKRFLKTWECFLWLSFFFLEIGGFLHDDEKKNLKLEIE